MKTVAFPLLSCGLSESILVPLNNCTYEGMICNIHGLLQVDQAALTGESLPVKKFPGHVAFSGSTIKQGETECLVYATGSNTFFGRAAALISGTHSVANIQKVLDLTSMALISCTWVSASI